jgi:UDP-N-acetylmuramoylalanine--D-glutamate ligase
MIKKKIIILGYGREGVSSYSFIRKHFPTMPLTIADKSPIINVDDVKDDLNLNIIAGESYDDNLNDYDLILKSPGVSFSHLNYFVSPEKLTSQTDLFMRAFSNQIIGVTGTKGKNKASLIFHILKNNDLECILVGNNGIPFFEL